MYRYVLIQYLYTILAYGANTDGLSTRTSKIRYAAVAKPLTPARSAQARYRFRLAYAKCRPTSAARSNTACRLILRGSVRPILWRPGVSAGRSNEETTGLVGSKTDARGQQRVTEIARAIGIAGVDRCACWRENENAECGGLCGVGHRLSLRGVRG